MTAEEYGPVVSHTDGQWDVQPAPGGEVATAEKRCTLCGELKPLAEFPVDRQKRTGRSPRCLDCNASRVRAAQSAYADRTDEQIAADRARLRTDGRKRCLRCRQALAFDAFAVSRYMADGLQGRCRTCVRADKQNGVKP